MINELKQSIQNIKALLEVFEIETTKKYKVELVDSKFGSAAMSLTISDLKGNTVYDDVVSHKVWNDLDSKSFMKILLKALTKKDPKDAVNVALKSFRK